MTATEKLRAAQKKQKSGVCIGIDPELKKMPVPLLEKHNIDPQTFDPFDDDQRRRAANMYYEFATTIVRRTAEYCCAFKPNMGFFGALGHHGFKCLERLCAFIRNEYPDHFLIIDGKRNDIGNTAEQYGLEYCLYQADMVTWNPYMGCDTAVPFFKAGLGVLALCLTSNPGAKDFQYPVLSSDGKPMYLHVARKTLADFGASGNLGLVVGATHAEELGEIRQAVGNDVLFLIPGLKTQGGKPEDVIKANAGGLAVVNFSRDVLYASAGDDWADAAAARAQKNNEELNQLRQAA